MRVPRKAHWWRMLQAAKSEALLAVDLYNQTIERRNFEAFVVHMHIAWLYLLHAEFERAGIDCRYRERDGRRFVKIDGEPKTWELKKCVEHRWEEDDPVRKNIEFFIGLRNKIEHRFNTSISVITTGHSHAHVLNFERELVDQFGEVESMGDELRFPIFLRSLTDHAAQALESSATKLPKRIREYLVAFEEGLDSGIRNDPRFELRVYLIPHTSAKSQADMAITFIHEDDVTEEMREELDKRGSQGVVISRERTRGVVHLNRLRPSDVAAAVQVKIPFRFHPQLHAEAWKKYGVRPRTGAQHPERTDERYCFYDDVHKDYVYTNAWVRKLIRDLATESGFREALGRAPQSKSECPSPTQAP